jgi:hypothetical protein
MDIKRGKKTVRTQKERGGSLPGRSLRELFQRGAESFGEPSTDAAATSEPSAETLAGWDEPLVRNPPEVKIKYLSLGSQWY